jgi:hypothetical protein
MAGKVMKGMKKDPIESFFLCLAQHDSYADNNSRPFALFFFFCQTKFPKSKVFLNFRPLENMFCRAFCFFLSFLMKVLRACRKSFPWGVYQTSTLFHDQNLKIKSKEKQAEFLQ